MGGIILNGSQAGRTQERVCPHLGRSTAICYGIFSLVSVSIHLPFPLISSTICSFVHLLSPAVSHPCLPPPSMHGSTFGFLPHPGPPRPCFELEIQKESSQVPGSFILPFVMALECSETWEGIGSCSICRWMGCGYHSRPHSAFFLLHPWNYPCPSRLCPFPQGRKV